MEFNANMMRDLLKKSDAELWQTVRGVAEANGITLPGGTPSAGDMARLRAILGTKGAGDVEEAMEVLRRARGGR